MATALILVTATTVAALGVVAPGSATAAPRSAPAPHQVAAPAAKAARPTTKVPLLKTPPMGFNDWNAFGCDVSDKLIRQTADFFLSSGLKAAGYTYVNIDDCWMTKTRSASGHLVVDRAKFPKGMKSTADYVHSKGLKIGIYEDAGTLTCGGYPGSLGHEQTDANDFAAWGIDYLKYDNCSNSSDGSLADYRARYTAMGKALLKTGRPIVYSICEWGVNDPADWAGEYGHLWRTTGDINDSWGSLKSIIEQNAPLSYAAKPNSFNDPDMLEVGNGGMTDTEYRTHFSLWAVMASPLLIGTDLRVADQATMDIYLNKEVIAVDQDKLAVQAQVISDRNGTKVFNKPLANGDRAVALYNSTDHATTVRTTTAQIGLPKTGGYTAKDLWSKKTTETAGTIAANVPAHGTVLMRVKANSNWPAVAPATTVTLASSTANVSDVAVTPGDSATVSATVENQGRAALQDVRVTATAPSGWMIRSTGKISKRRVGTNAALTTQWTITAPAKAEVGQSSIPLTVSYQWGDRGRTAVTHTDVSVQVVTKIAPGKQDLSKLDWVSATNGWGPVEVDQSNGEDGARDGSALTIAKQSYALGFGVNAPSDIVYYLGGTCSSLTTTVGLDDEVAGSDGDVRFQVFADEGKVADSGVLTSASGAKHLTVDVAGATWLRLHADPNGSADSDHADWAAPVLTCGAAS